MLQCRARQLARPVATGVATIATPNPIGRDKAFPSPKSVSSSETTEAMGDPSLLSCDCRLAASPPGACSEPMSQKNARHDRIRRIGTFLKDVESAVLWANRKPHGLLQRFCDPPLSPHEVDSAAEFDLAGDVP